jgi:hypothetical protein
LQIVLGAGNEHANPAHPLGLLRAHQGGRCQHCAETGY